MDWLGNKGLDLWFDEVRLWRIRNEIQHVEPGFSHKTLLVVSHNFLATINKDRVVFNICILVVLLPL